MSLGGAIGCISTLLLSTLTSRERAQVCAVSSEAVCDVARAAVNQPRVRAHIALQRLVVANGLANPQLSLNRSMERTGGHTTQLAGHTDLVGGNEARTRREGRRRRSTACGGAALASVCGLALPVFDLRGRAADSALHNTAAVIEVITFAFIPPSRLCTEMPSNRLQVPIRILRCVVSGALVTLNRSLRLHVRQVRNVNWSRRAPCRDLESTEPIGAS